MSKITQLFRGSSILHLFSQNSPAIQFSHQTAQRTSEEIISQLECNKDYLNELASKSHQHTFNLEEIIHAQLQHLKVIDKYLHEGQLRHKIQFAAERRDLLVRFARLLELNLDHVYNQVDCCIFLLQAYAEIGGELSDSYVRTLCRVSLLTGTSDKLKATFSKLKFKNQIRTEVAMTLFVIEPKEDYLIVIDDISHESIKDFSNQQLIKKFYMAVAKYDLDQENYNGAIKSIRSLLEADLNVQETEELQRVLSHKRFSDVLLDLFGRQIVNQL